ncbi:hypothetical protein CDV36_009271 [Fusarium kuroshium]|uniref:Uncharacterized protein n=1 Tax=Fusarium kuroshium TaxID=2010991 RepID=A0A3M2S0L5_9HYPO|nr:hypothetical protein CDV36_009271 [Fusarium kuroshium]
MGIIGLIASHVLPPSENSRRYNTNSTNGYCNHRIQPAYLVQPQQQPMAPNMDYAYMTTGRSSCHQRKMERRYQRKMQRVERGMLRAEQRAERDMQRADRREAGVMHVKSGMQKIGITKGPSGNVNVHETREAGGSFEMRDMPSGARDTRHDNVFELDAVNQRHTERDAPPAYQEVEKK